MAPITQIIAGQEYGPNRIIAVYPILDNQGRSIMAVQHKDGRPRSPKWLVRCQSGHEWDSNSARLKMGTACWQCRELMASKKYAYRHATLAAVRGNCAVYNPISRVLRMTMDEYVSIVTQPCHYCGIEPNQVSRAPRKLMTPLDFVHHGMDRKDNTSTVYSLDTVVTACAECNKAKGAQTYDEFLDRCRRIALKHPVDNKCQI